MKISKHLMVLVTGSLLVEGSTKPWFDGHGAWPTDQRQHAMHTISPNTRHPREGGDPAAVKDNQP